MTQSAFGTSRRNALHRILFSAAALVLTVAAAEAASYRSQVSGFGQVVALDAIGQADADVATAQAQASATGVQPDASGADRRERTNARGDVRAGAEERGAEGVERGRFKGEVTGGASQVGCGRGFPSGEPALPRIAALFHEPPPTPARRPAPRRWPRP